MKSIYQLLGESIKQIRIKNNLSDENIANRLGVNTRYLKELEKGNKRITVKLLCDIADALDIKVTEIFDKINLSEV